MQHPIKRYCDARNMSQKDFAQLVGLSEGFVSQLINSREVCGRTAGRKIVRATDGAIELEELMEWEATAAA